MAYKVTIIGYTIFGLGIALIISRNFLRSYPELGSVLQVLGAALVPSGVISLVTEYFIRKDVMDQMADFFDGFLLGHLDDIHLAGQGIGFIHDSNPTAEICQEFSRARRQILMYNGWIPDIEGLHRGLREAIQRNVGVNILLLNPESKLSSMRAAEIGLANPERQRDYTAIDLENLTEFIDRVGGRQCVEIRLFDELTVAPIYATEEKMYVGWFYKARRAVTGPVVKVHGANAPLSIAMRESFSHVWNNKDTVKYYPRSNL